MEKDFKGRDIRTLINVSADGCIEDHPSLPFEHKYGKVGGVSVDFYPHAVELRKLLVDKGFDVSEIKSTAYSSPGSSRSTIIHGMEVRLKTIEERDKLRELLDSGVYNMTYY